MEIAKSMMIAAAGMQSQTERMRIIAENIANANSTAHSPEEDPYRRQVPTFENSLNREMNVPLVHMAGTVSDYSEFREQYNPGHPAADAQGYVKLPNVDPLIEMMDMRQAQRSFDANVSVIDSARSMLARTIELLRR